MKGRTSRVLLLATVLALGVLAWFVKDDFETVEQTVEVGYRGEARVNPFLAAERLYTALDAPARTLPGAPRGLPPADHALLVLSPKRSFSRQRADKLFAWVRGGGHLVVALDEAPSLDPLLAHYGVRLKGDPETETGSETVEVRLHSGVTAHVEIAKAPRLVDPSHTARFAAGSALGSFLLRFDEGAGRVTLLSDPSFLTNERIGRGDHARVAWALVQRASEAPPRGVWIVVREDLPTLAGLLARHAWAASLSGLLLLGAWLWSAGARFGPVLPDPPRGRRSLLEHIQAAGDFLLRTGRGEDLAQSARQALLRRVEIREPDWSKLPLPELAQRLAQHAKLPVPRIESALRGPVLGAADLAATVQTLETLRRSL
jgi:hypothetical protein